MPSTPYDLVRDDQDLRIPLHPEQAFFHGISFQAKLIGWQDVPRPSSRTEIVQAMRKIRYECKVQNMKKRKVTITVSADGVKVTLKKKKRKKKQWEHDSDAIELMQHPIYRIFYVSHDSSDLKIFSYIARDGSSDTFKCSVFKSNKKSQAMRIVRTVGQAFEVCHKFNLQKNSLDHNDDRSETPCDELSDRCSDHISDDDEPKKERLPVTPEAPLKRPNHLDIVPMSNFNNRKSPMHQHIPPISASNSSIIPTTASTAAAAAAGTTTTTSNNEIHQLREQLEQQALQTRQALAQLMLVREQLITETNARIEAQARTQQLLQQNRELLEHLASLGGYNENDRPGLTSATLGLAPQLSSTAKVARWFQLNSNPQSLSRPESGFVSGDSRSEKYPDEHQYIFRSHNNNKDHVDDLCDEYLLVEGANNLWSKLTVKKRRKLLGLRLGKVTTF